MPFCSAGGDSTYQGNSLMIATTRFCSNADVRSVDAQLRLDYTDINRFVFLWVRTGGCVFIHARNFGYCGGWNPTCLTCLGAMRDLMCWRNFRYCGASGTVQPTCTSACENLNRFCGQLPNAHFVWDYFCPGNTNGCPCVNNTLNNDYYSTSAGCTGGAATVVLSGLAAFAITLLTIFGLSA